MNVKDVVVLIGSLRKGSFNRKIAQALGDIAPATLQLQPVEIGDLPLYNPDIEAAPSAAWTRVRERVRPAHGVLFVTAEYNRSIPACLKNAVDVGSRPYGHSVWSGKPGAIVSASTGAIGGFGANHHLRQWLVAIGVSAMAQPEAYIGGVDKLFDAAGKLAMPTREFLAKYLQAFAEWIDKNAAS
jgi:chromate reductase